MKIIFLVIDYMPHQLISIKEILKYPKVEIHSFSCKNSDTIPIGIQGLYSYKLSDYSKTNFLETLIELKPDLLVVAGWFISEYVWVAKKIRKLLLIPVVTYSDTQWQGTWKQKINCLISHWYVKKAFSHIWIAGFYQYEYARKLGFAKNNIIYNSLSCNLELFKTVRLEHKSTCYPKNFLFIGRFIPVKGLEFLRNAWEQIPDKQGWTLTLVGIGPLKELFLNTEGVIIKDFMAQKELINEMETAGCFVLPSFFEPWAVVIHEAVAAGLPVIATNVCGATPHFVVSGFNGFQVNVDSKSIQQAMKQIMELNTEQLIRFSYNSRCLAQSITPELGAANLMSIISTRHNS